jgi:hypothetical protein
MDIWVLPLVMRDRQESRARRFGLHGHRVVRRLLEIRHGRCRTDGSG